MLEVTECLIYVKNKLPALQNYRLLPKLHVLGKDSYVFLYYLYSIVFSLYYFIESARPGELVWAVLTQALFTAVYFHSYWVRSSYLLVHSLAIFLMALLWSNYNPLAIVFYFYVPYIILYANLKVGEKFLLMSVVITASMQTYFISDSIVIASFMFISMSINIAAERQRLNHQESNAKLLLSYEEIEQLTRIAERSRIAQDLHDILGQELTSLILGMELHKVQFDQYSTDEYHQNIEKWIVSTRKIMSTIRSISYRLYSVSLGSEIETLQNQFNNLNVSFNVTTTSNEISTALENIIILILKECATNTMRHAKATKVTLSIREVDQGINFRYQDNGIGFRNRKGFGLSGISERVNRLHGRVDFFNDNGAVVDAIIPKPEGLKIS